MTAANGGLTFFVLRVLDALPAPKLEGIVQQIEAMKRQDTLGEVLDGEHPPMRDFAEALVRRMTDERRREPSDA
jgi:hypothetical protein